jgi:phosphopantothenoylcysteine decarboxylase/phosphopantothenate--cysteine ligase
VATIVLGVTGCIAAYKACEVLRELQRAGCDVRVVMTRHATHFVGPQTFEALSRHPVLIDLFENATGGSMAHIQWGSDAALLLVAPATANVLAKFAHGVADDALTTLYLAMPGSVVVAPAMNVHMWRHPATMENLRVLRARGVSVIDPGEGELACGVMGAGRLADVGAIVKAARAALSLRQDLAGERVLVTAGPTQENIDAVRFISNRSSGRMGYRLAEAARDRGAAVTLISGPTAIAEPHGVEIVRVRSAEDMAGATRARAESATIVVMAAAGCDHRPARAVQGKIKRADMPTRLDLDETPDILRELGEKKGGRVLVGFAAETESLAANARKKLEDKKLDLIVANDVSVALQGFESENNAAVLIDAGQETEVPLTSKRELADRIFDRIVEIRRMKGKA